MRMYTTIAVKPLFPSVKVSMSTNITLAEYLSPLDLSMNQSAITVLSLLLILFVLCLQLNESKPLNSDETWLDSIDSSIRLKVRSISRPVPFETHHILFRPRMKSID